MECGECGEQWVLSVGVVCGEFGVWYVECGDYMSGMRAASEC